ncbi:MAG: peptide deformylase [Actinomycetia bacterium]|nr:peptide deformylase [Actinomycetes bacterium]
MTETEQVEAEDEAAAEPADPELEARRDFALAQVRQYPDSALRMRAREVEEFGEPLERLVGRMIRLMNDACGVGLAAPQVGVLQRILVYQADPESDAVALVNPSIVSGSPEVETGEEGCLSLARATVTVDVERSSTVTVEGCGADGAAVRIEADGLEARVLQHEIDHLDGVLIIDRTSAEERKRALGELRPAPQLGRAR